MLKNILNIEGAQKLSKNEQKEINGGIGTNGNCITNALNNGCRLKTGPCDPITLDGGEFESCNGKVCCTV